MIKTSKNYKAFTLAETLITLVVIGVVAALTIPNIVANHRKEETVTKLQKIYSTISQTTNKAIADNGPIKTWEVGNNKSKEFVEKYMLPYLNVAKNCGYETAGDCNFEWSYLNSPEQKNAYGNNYYKLILADGSSITVWVRIMNVFFYNVVSQRSHAQINVDINGLKGPNVYGKDIFIFIYWIKNDYSAYGGPNYSGKFWPDGGLGDKEYQKQYCNKNSTGQNCAALIMADNWQITEDYPW